MPKKKTPKNNYREKHSKLKALGVFAGRLKKDGNYTTAEKRQLSTLYNKFSKEADWAKEPQRYKGQGAAQTFTSRELKSRADVKRAKDAGFKTYKNKVLIRHNKGERVRLVMKKIPGTNKVRPTITVTNPMGARWDTVIADGKEIIDYLESLKDKTVAENTNGAYDQVTVRIGDHNAFKTPGSQAVTYGDLLNYLKNWSPKGSADMDADELTELKFELIGEMTEVHVEL